MKKYKKIKFVCPRCGGRLMMIRKELDYKQGNLININTGQVNKQEYKTEPQGNEYEYRNVMCVKCGLESYEGTENEFQSKIDKLADIIFDLEDEKRKSKG